MPTLFSNPISHLPSVTAEGLNFVVRGKVHIHIPFQALYEASHLFPFLSGEPSLGALPHAPGRGAEPAAVWVLCQRRRNPNAQRQANRAGSPAPSRWAPLNLTCSKGPGVGARAPCSGWSRAWSRRSRHGAGGLWGLSWARPFLRVMCAGWSCVLLCPTSP